MYSYYQVVSCCNCWRKHLNGPQAIAQRLLGTRWKGTSLSKLNHKLCRSFQNGRCWVQEFITSFNKSTLWQDWMNIHQRNMNSTVTLCVPPVAYRGFILIVQWRRFYVLLEQWFSQIFFLWPLCINHTKKSVKFKYTFKLYQYFLI
jgi:hypothetical protein